VAEQGLDVHPFGQTYPRTEPNSVLPIQFITASTAIEPSVVLAPSHDVTERGSVTLARRPSRPEPQTPVPRRGGGAPAEPPRPLSGRLSGSFSARSPRRVPAVKSHGEFFTRRKSESPASRGFPRSGRSTRGMIQLGNLLMTRAIGRCTIHQGDRAMHPP
jgi:hypothetical protein